MPAPKFSVVIPLYNKEESIHKSIQSILKQTLQPQDIVVVDDGSTDNSASVVKEYMKTTPNLKLVSKENGGVSLARNIGAEHASSEFICFIDADDEWETYFLEEVSHLIKKFPGCGAYTTNYHFILDHGERQLPRCEHQRDQHHIMKNYFEIASRGDLPTHVSGLCVPKSIFLETGGFPVGERFGEDQMVYAKIALKYNIGFSKRACFSYRLCGENRVMLTEPPEKECLFSRYLKEVVDEENISSAKKESILRYTGGHLLHLAKQNILAGKLSVARHLLNDPRSKLLPKRKIWWEFRWGVAWCRDHFKPV